MLARLVLTLSERSGRRCHGEDVQDYCHCFFGRVFFLNPSLCIRAFESAALAFTPNTTLHEFYLLILHLCCSVSSCSLLSSKMGSTLLNKRSHQLLPTFSVDSADAPSASSLPCSRDRGSPADDHALKLGHTSSKIWSDIRDAIKAIGRSSRGGKNLHIIAFLKIRSSDI